MRRPTRSENFPAQLQPQLKPQPADQQTLGTTSTLRPAASATGTLSSTTTKSMYQLRRSTTICERLSFEGWSTPNDTATSQLLPHQPRLVMDLPIESARNEPGRVSRNVAIASNGSFLRQLWTDGHSAPNCVTPETTRQEEH